MDFYNANKEKINKLLFVLVVVAFIYVFIHYLFDYIAPFAFGFLFSIILEPLAYFLVKKLKIKRGIAAFICILVLVFIVGGIGTGIISRIVSEAKAFSVYAFNYLNHLPSEFLEARAQYENILELFPEELGLALDDTLTALLSSITTALGASVKSGTGNFVVMIPNLLMSTLLTVISTFFFIMDKQSIFAFTKSITPAWLREKFSKIKQGLFNAILGYLKAQAIIMSIIAIICITGLAIINYQYALFVGIVIAVIDSMPIFGSGFVLWPWAAISFISKDYKTAIALLIIYGTVIITRQSLEPRILGRQIGIHPLFTLASMYIGLKIFGVLGFFIGPLTAVIIKVLLEKENELL